MSRRLPPARVIPMAMAPRPGPFTWVRSESVEVGGYLVDGNGVRMLGINLMPVAGGFVDPADRRRRIAWLLEAVNRQWHLEENQKANERAYGPGGTAP